MELSKRTTKEQTKISLQIKQKKKKGLKKSKQQHQKKTITLHLYGVQLQYGKDITSTSENIECTMIRTTYIL